MQLKLDCWRCRVMDYNWPTLHFASNRYHADKFLNPFMVKPELSSFTIKLKRYSHRIPLFVRLNTWLVVKRRFISRPLFWMSVLFALSVLCFGLEKKSLIALLTYFEVGPLFQLTAICNFFKKQWFFGGKMTKVTRKAIDLVPRIPRYWQGTWRRTW